MQKANLFSKIRLLSIITSILFRLYSLMLHFQKLFYVFCQIYFIFLKIWLPYICFVLTLSLLICNYFHNDSKSSFNFCTISVSSNHEINICKKVNKTMFDEKLNAINIDSEYQRAQNTTLWNTKRIFNAFKHFVVKYSFCIQLCNKFMNLKLRFCRGILTYAIFWNRW